MERTRNRGPNSFKGTGKLNTSAMLSSSFGSHASHLKSMSIYKVGLARDVLSSSVNVLEI